jgi:hypothetical protein
MAEMNGGDNAASVSAARGPAYPYVDLRKAVERAQVVADKGGGRQPMPPESFYSLWGIGAKSSSARQTLAALNYYGLVDYMGRGKDRRAKLTDLAKQIVFDQQENSAEKAAAIRQAALEPPIFRELFERYGHILPADTVFHTYLMRDKGFTKQGAEAATDNYKSTFEYAALAEPDKKPDENVSNVGDSGVEYGGARVGDLIDYEAGGAIANPEPMRVRALSPDQAWVFVEGSETGLEMDQVIVKERGHSEVQAKDRPTMPLAKSQEQEEAKPGTRRAIFPLDDGDVTLTFPEGLSTEALTDLDDYLKIFLKKERAKAAKPV